MVTCTIAIATHKGGTGKTVTAMALSAALARAGQTCLLVDLDPQGHSTLGLGVELAEGEPTLHACFSEPALPLSRVIRTTHLPGLHLAPANLRLARVAQALYMRPKREEVLRRACEPMAAQYAYIVLDCPPALGVLTEAALTAADLIVIPCQLEARAADGLVDLLEVKIPAASGGALEGGCPLCWGNLSPKPPNKDAIPPHRKQWGILA